MKAILVSRRFNPGHLSHIDANAMLLREAGYQTLFRLNKKFALFSKKEECAIKTSLRECIGLSKDSLFIVWFPSLAAMLDVMLVKLFSKCNIIYIYHEPYTSFRSYLNSGFGLIKTLRITGVSQVSKIICLLADKVVLPSANAFNAVPAARLNSHRYAQINLMFLDEAITSNLSLPRIFISYIGTIAEDHAFDQFVNFAYQAVRTNKLQPYKFLVASRSNIPLGLKDKIDYCVGSGRMSIQTGAPFSNSEINNYYLSSFVIWNAYRRSMQSGVLPKAYMFGAPVLLSKINKNEYFISGIHGVSISSDYEMQDFCHAITEIECNWDFMSKNCRASFLELFCYKSIKPNFINFVQGNS